MEALRNDYLAEVKNNGIEQRQEITAAAMDRFIKYLDVAPKTAATYTRALRQFAAFLVEQGIRRPERSDILLYRDTLQAEHKPTTVQSYMTATRLFFRWTAQEGIYPNVADHIKGAKLDKEFRKDYLTVSQVKEILNGIDRSTLQGLRNYAILYLMVSGGLRDIEVSRANIEDLRAAGNETVLYVQGKGHQERTDYVKVGAPVEKAIRAYLKARGKAAENEPLFVSTSNRSKGQRLNTNAISTIVKQAMQEAGYDSERWTAHSLRHTAVTLSILSGMELTEVQQFARHRSLETTMIYNHALDKAKNRCANTICSLIED